MGRIFNLDSPVMRFLGRVADLMILNLLFLVCSLPVVTIGASLSGLSYVTLKMAEGTEGYIVKPFFKSFKQNFRQATVIWLLVLVFGAALGVDFYLLSASEGTAVTAIRVLLLVSAMLFFMLFLYVFPVLARFYNTIAGTIKNALLISIGNLPRTLLCMVIVVAPILATFINGYTLMYGLMLWILFGFSLISLCTSKVLCKVLAKYMPKEESEPSEDCIVDPLPEEDDELKLH